MLLRRAGISFLQLAIVLAGLEICLRIYNPLPFRLRADRIVLPVGRVYVFNNAPTAKLDPVARHTKNALGFRGPDPPRDFAGRVSVVTIGGSTTECLLLSDGKTWTDVLERRLAPSIPDLWVNNAGLDGQSTYGHLVLLRDAIVPLRPRVAVFLVGLNDLGLATLNRYDRGLLPPQGALSRVLSVLAAHSELASASLNAIRARHARELGFSGGDLDLASAPHVTISPDAAAAIVADDDRGLPSYQQRLEEIVDLCRSHGIAAVLATQPALYGDARDPATGIDLATVSVHDGANGAVEWRRLERYNEVTRRVAASRSVPIVDLARELPKDSRLFYDYVHFGNEGAEKVGAIMADHLAPLLETQRRMPQSHRGTKIPSRTTCQPAVTC